MNLWKKNYLEIEGFEILKIKKSPHHFMKEVVFFTFQPEADMLKAHASNLLNYLLKLEFKMARNRPMFITIEPIFNDDVERRRAILQSKDFRSNLA